MTYFSKEFPKNWKKLDKSFWSYLAGFIDGDGSLFVRIIPVKSDINYKIIISIGLYQHKKYIFFLNKIWQIFNKSGNLRIRPNSDMADLVISNKILIKQILTRLYPYLILKKPQAKLLLKIIKEYKDLSLEKNLSYKKAAFLEVCKKIDKVADMNNSKNRKYTYESVLKSYKHLPVETWKKKFPDN